MSIVIVPRDAIVIFVSGKSPSCDPSVTQSPEEVSAVITHRKSQPTSTVGFNNQKACVTVQRLKMGLCISSQRQDFEGIRRYDGGTLLCFRHGEGTYLYENGDMYKGEWKCNKKHGHGVYTHVNGEM